MTTHRYHTLPEEEAERSHLSQVHSKDTTDLLEGKYLLLFVPSGALHLPVILRELGTGVEAGGRAGGAGHAMVTRVPADESVGGESTARHQPKMAAVTCITTDAPH